MTLQLRELKYEKALLVDDRDKSLAPFKEKGGQTIKFDQYKTDLEKELKSLGVNLNNSPRYKMR